MLVRRVLFISLVALFAFASGCAPATPPPAAPQSAATQPPAPQAPAATEAPIVTEAPAAPEAPAATEAPAPEKKEPVVNDYKGELIVSVWGGTTEEWLRAHVEPEFKKIYPNVTVTYDVGGMAARYNKLLAQKSSPTVDVFFSVGENLVGAIEEGLLAKVNRDNLPDVTNLYDWAIVDPDYGAAYGALAEGIGYNPDFFGDNPPTSWKDLWRPEINGRISVPAVGHSTMPEFFTIVAGLFGGSADNIQPGLDALTQLKPAAQTFFYTGWNAQFDSGEIVLAVEFDYYINAMADTGSNIKFCDPIEGSIGSLQHVSMVAGTENPEMVEAYINLLFTPKIQQSVGEDLLNGPASKAIVLSPELDERLVIYGESSKNVIWFDPHLAAKVRNPWTELFNQQVAPIWGTP